MVFILILICDIVALVMPWLNILYVFVLYMLCVGRQVAKEIIITINYNILASYCIIIYLERFTILGIRPTCFMLGTY